MEQSKELTTKEYDRIHLLLCHNVPRFVAHIKARGLKEEEWHWLQCDKEDINYPMHLLLQADKYLFYPKDDQTFNHALFVLVKAIAIMAFIPGGVRVFGLHFCSEFENFVNDKT